MHERWKAANPEKYAKTQREYAARRRQRLINEMLDAYGGACSCCGESNPVFLSLEHVGGLDGKPRVNVVSEIVRLKKAGWPKTCTILCFNCNLGSFRNGGICPHQVIEIEAV